jgi:hypothetical protein
LSNPPIKSVYSDEQQYLLQRNNSLGVDVGQRMYGMDRSTPMDALKDMIRNYYSPNTALENKNIIALVLKTELKAPTQLGLAQTSKKDPDSDISLLRVRVLSDARHFWIPQPRNSTDPAINLHPFVRSEEPYPDGTLVTVDFDNDKYQFSSNLDIGSITGRVSETQFGFDGTPIEKNTTLMPYGRAQSNRPRGMALYKDIGFVRTVENIAREFNTDPKNLWRVMDFESKLDPQAVNPKSKAVGLIQFMPKTAKALGTTSQDIFNMLPVQQLELMRRYFIQNGVKKIKRPTYGDLYLLVFYPYAIDKSNWFQIGTEKSLKWAHEVAKQNPVFPKNRRGLIDRGSVIKTTAKHKFRFAK